MQRETVKQRAARKRRESKIVDGIVKKTKRGIIREHLARKRKRARKAG